MAFTRASALAFTLLLATAVANPTSRERLEVEEFLRGRDKTRLFVNVIESMEQIMAENLMSLFNKVNSLTQVSNYLLSEGQDMKVVQGRRGDMSDRCPKGFVAVPGNRNCYYFSTYKQPWELARETCLQLGPNVDMLSLETTKKHFVVTHLIQSNQDTKHVKKWWTSGRGTGNYWAWMQRLSLDQFFFKFFENSDDKDAKDSDSCLVLDSEYYYKWKRVSCQGQKRAARTGEPDEASRPSHHFICQTPALEPSSIEADVSDEGGSALAPGDGVSGETTADAANSGSTRAPNTL